MQILPQSAISWQLLKKRFYSLKKTFFLRLKGLKMVLKKVPWFENFFTDFGSKPPVFPWFPWLEKVFKIFPDFPDRWEPCVWWCVHTGCLRDRERHWDQDRDEWVVWFYVESFTLHLYRVRGLTPIVPHCSGSRPSPDPIPDTASVVTPWDQWSFSLTTKLRHLRCSEKLSIVCKSLCSYCSVIAH